MIYYKKVGDLMAKRYNENIFFRSLDGVAYGIFCSEVIGYFVVWISQLLRYPQLTAWGNMITGLSGCAVGIGVAYTTGARGLALLCSALAGSICQGSGVSWVICAYLAIMISASVGDFLRNKTPLDIFITPTITIIIACMITTFVSPYLNNVVSWIVVQLINASATSPLFMGMCVAMLMSLISVTPLSLLGVCALANIGGLSAGATLAGTCGTMLGLAIMSVEDNDLGDVIAIGIGSPILQLKNCIKNPLVLIPILLSAMVTGALSTTLFHLSTTQIGASKGCLMFEGPLSVINYMGFQAWVGMLICDVMLPILICYSGYHTLKRLGWIKSGDLKINRF